ncbi:hypothetical protein A8C56_14140 [Niabella ginsenosidivorans]|uniref:Teneurin-like YD-shell domain-containing protein n=1 Tax=Niabella ginsenosidivorans TaxID=1176587 RepID=A0A1A9I3R4_9BACT|nr:RHS repeat-associated core domain-containing protein [Niabella ginsenosidivorans]ANH81955.1 hypothetical protein A8C56_14140 [Niabella ginsenosidivorans]
MGNITKLKRPKNSTTAITYNYGAKGNQLQSVSGGYARSYTYNGNDSVATITGTNPLTITYNALNLPRTVTGSATVSYVYDADGNKLKKTTSTETRWYIDGIEYITNSTTPSPAIDLLQTAEGVARRSGTTYNYEYFLKDHLGNTRIVFNKAGTVLQQTDYYPFGMSVARVANTPNRYLYNGKEQQQELGGTDGGQYDYGARFYDPVIGRWHVIDPASELGRRHSPYTFAFNNPIRFIDPDGMWPGDFYDESGRKIGTDGIDDKKKYVVINNREARDIARIDRRGGTTQVSDVSSAKALPSDVALNESLDVIKRTEAKTTADPQGGLHGESSIVMKDGTVLRGDSGPAAFVNSNNELQADEKLSDLPSGKTPADAETTIHSHVTGTVLQNGQIYSHDATKPSNVGLPTFSQYGTNIIVGPRGQASATQTNGSTNISQPGNGVIIYKGGTTTPYLVLPVRTVERILRR